MCFLCDYYCKFRLTYAVISRFAVLGVLVLSASFHTNLSAAVINVSASQQSVYVGDTVELNFVISGLDSTEGSSLSGFDMDVHFDSLIFSFAGLSFSDPVHGNQLDLSAEASPWSFQSGYSLLTPDIVDVYALSGNSASYLDNNQQTTFRFLSISFTALLPAIDALIALDIFDPELLFINSLFDDLAVTTDVYSVQLSVRERVTAVPEPATFYLMTACLLLLLIMRYPSFRSQGGIQ